ncbi:MAG TPA: MFS transporter [Syntrophomonadaceae bacterium]|nr:MFS transporter [Syntrophomonadaceae bacterium]HQA06952.1 MFS transporter [Syntrophomonadaceae bacterium]HQE23154.1 MFS transporter [Syntrophomonadaceae bacterium]
MISSGRGNYRYCLIAILAVTYMFIYLQRTNVSMLLVDTRFLEEVNLLGQTARQGLLMTVFLLAYSLSNILMIPVISRLGPRRSLILGIVMGSLILMFGGWAASFAAIIAVRILLGIAHGIQYPNFSVLVKNWFPPWERGTANAIYSMGGTFAPALAVPLFGWLISSWGWEYSFFVPAALGLVCVIPLLLGWITSRPDDNPSISAGEVAYIKSHQPVLPAAEDNNQKGKGTSQIWHNPAFWLLCIAYAAFMCSWWGLLTWIPQYLVQARNFDMSGMTSYVTITYLVAMGSCFIGGRLVDRVQHKSIVGFVALSSVALATFGISALPSSRGAVICIILAVGINEFVFPAAWAILQAITPDRLMAASSGMISGTANLFSSMTPFIIGFLIQITGSYASGLMFLVVMSVLGALSCLTLLRQGH